MNIGAIETRYAGRLFRSRLEARWAVFFDALSIEWQYEPQGFEAEGMRYLPDFYLPACNMFVEVKGDPGAIAADRDRISAVLIRTDLGKSSGLLLLSEIPRLGDLIAHPGMCVCADGVERRWFSWVPTFERGYVPYEHDDSLLATLHGLARDDEWNSRHRSVDGLRAFVKVNDAYQSAASARFEHGQSGAIR